MIKQFFRAVDKVSGIPRRVIFGGTLPALFLLAAAACLLLGHEVSYDRFVLSRHMCKTAVTLFSEGVVLGLLFDAFLNK